MGREKQIEIHSEKTQENVYKMLSPREMQFTCPFKKNERILYFYNNNKTMPWLGVLFSITGRIQESLKLCQVNWSQNSIH